MKAEQGPPSSQAKMLRVLEALATAEGSQHLGALAVEAGVSKPTAHRLLAGLMQAGYAQRDEQEKYVIGPALIALGAQASGHKRSLIADRLTQLRDATGQTVHLAMRSRNHAIYTEKITGKGAIQFASTVGARLELHASGIGKAILAAMPEDERRTVIGDLNLRQRTEWTISTPQALVEAVEAVRERGYAIDDEENETNVRCLAIAIHNRRSDVIGGISISTIKPLLPEQELLAMQPALAATARDIETLL